MGQDSSTSSRSPAVRILLMTVTAGLVSPARCSATMLSTAHAATVAV
jgi:hypothetical protein